jgi:hypothetical protein
MESHDYGGLGKVEIRIVCHPLPEFTNHESRAPDAPLTIIGLNVAQGHGINRGHPEHERGIRKVAEHLKVLWLQKINFGELSLKDRQGPAECLWRHRLDKIGQCIL